jgi:hypothetical protein
MPKMAIGDQFRFCASAPELSCITGQVISRDNSEKSFNLDASYLQYQVLGTQHSALGTRHSALGTRHSALGTRY